MEDVRFGRPFGGGQLTRQISSSHVTPRSMSGYQDFFRMSSSREEGWLETKIGRAERWERMWVVFDDGVLYYSTDRGADRDDADSVTKVPMDRVISLRTDDQYGDSTIQIVTTEHKLYIRAPSKDEKSVALVLSRLLLSSSKSTPSMKAAINQSNFSQPLDYQGNHANNSAKEWSRSGFAERGGISHRDSEGRVYSVDGDTDSSSDVTGAGGRVEDDKKIWLAELGHGHGKHSSLASRRITFSDGISQSLYPSKSISMFLCDESDDGDRVSNGNSSRNSSPALAAPEAARRSVWDRSYAERSVVDLTRMSLQESTYESLNDTNDPNSLGTLSNTKPKFMSSSVTMSKSPMIPIVELMSSRSLFDPKLAGSYSDSLNRERVMVGLSLSPPETDRMRSTSIGSRSSDQSGGCQLDYDYDEQSPDSDGDMMFDFDDLDIQSCNNVQKSSSKKSKGNRSRGNSNLSNGSNTAPAVGAVVDSSKSRRASSGRVLQPVELSGVRWLSGSCTKLGPRTSNEDRLVVLPNLLDAVIAAKSKTVSTGNSASSSVTVSTHYPVNSSHRCISANVLAAGIGVTSCEGLEYAQRQTDRHGYFAVYDGHCGAQAATHLQESLHLSIFNHPKYHTDLPTAIVESCVNTDRAFLAECRERKQYSGTTALGAIVRGSELVVFNIGDCHAVLCHNGVALDMSDPHKPNRPDEAARILAARGWITEEKELYMARLHRMDLTDPLVRDKAQQVSWVTIHRVCGEISVSRSIGDPDYKTFQPGEKVDAFFIWPDGHDQVFMADLLIPIPECRSITLRPGHEFLIIASDGLWDVVSGTEAISRAKNALALGKSASEAAEELCDLALKLGSSDNVTAVIVQFIHS